MKSDSIMHQRRRALEEHFFHQRDQHLLTQLKSAASAEEQQRALTAATGITDPEVLSRFHALGLGSETLSALTLVPLVQVAWSDGQMHAKEKEAILRAAEEAGLEVDSPAENLLRSWLTTEPSPELAATWQAYVKELVATLDDAQRQALEESLVGRARRVAEAAGGFLGLGKKVSDAEERTLQELASAFRR